MTEMTRLLRLNDVRERTGLSTSTIYELVAAGAMPSPIRISARTTAWIEAEIEAFIRSRIATARKQDGRQSAGHCK